MNDNRQGAVLLEVLIATSLVSIVLVCLLESFRIQIRTDREVEVAVRWIDERSSLLDDLRRDLIDCRCIVHEADHAIGGLSGERAVITVDQLILLPSTSPTSNADQVRPDPIAYRWSTTDSALIRTTSSDVQSTSTRERAILHCPPVVFQLTIAPQRRNVDPRFPLAIRRVLVRDRFGDGASFAVDLPVAAPLIWRQEAGP